MSHFFVRIWLSAFFGIGALFWYSELSFWFCWLATFFVFRLPKFYILISVLWILYFLIRLEISQIQALRLAWLPKSEIEVCADRPTKFGSIVRIKDSPEPKLHQRLLYSNINIESGMCLKEEAQFRSLESYELPHFPGIELRRELRGIIGALKFKSKRKRKAQSESETDLSKFRAAVLTGDSSSLDPELWQASQRLGIAHLFVVSGLHIGFIFLFLNLIFRRLFKISVLWTSVSAASLIIFYLIYFDLALPAWRAAGLFVIFQIFSYLVPFVWRYQPIQILSLVGILTLVFQPLWLPSSTYILSFGICVFIFSSISPGRTYLSAAVGGQLLSSILFFSSSILSLPANLFFTPIFCFILFPILWLSWFFPIFESPVGWMLQQFIGVLEFVCEWSYKLPNFHLSFDQSFALGVSWIFFQSQMQARERWLVLWFSIFLLSGFLPIYRYHSNDSVEVLDVGQGDAIVASLEGRHIVIDGGRRPGLSEKLKQRGVREIDLWVLSHFDADHFEAFRRAGRDFRVNEIWLPRLDSSEAGRYLLSHYAGKLKESRGQNLIKSFGDYQLKARNMKFHSSHTKVSNKDSLILELWRGKQMMGLSLGDLPGAQEKAYLKLWKQRPEPILFLKVGHHGSKTSSSQQLIEFFQPKIALFPVGRNNSYKFPHPSVLDRFEREGATIRRTDTLGSIKVDF